MGAFDKYLTGHSIISLDTSVFIYHLEAHPHYQMLTRELFAGIESGLWEACTSIITILELTVQPHRLGRSDSAREYEAMITHFPHLTLLDVNRDIARCAARLRAHYNIGVADAVQAATGIIHGATTLITNDRRLARLSQELQLIILDDLLASPETETTQRNTP